ncbi:MAG TPA: polysaccharide deacetylase family protein [Draconibacterium sp.]|nr:polysaccharide deacetylase family protein [Draconibacterium sp.]
MNKTLIFLLLVLLFSRNAVAQNVTDQQGAVIRTDTLQKNIYLCFTGHDFYDGFEHVLGVLNKHNIKASFFLTGDFVREHADLVKTINKNGHFIGAHSDKHLLYCDWIKRDSLLHSADEIKADIQHNLQALENLGIRPKYFMPPYEWYNKKVVDIVSLLNQVTVNFSPGTLSNADYTTPEMPNYISNSDILKSIFNYEASFGMNGFHMLIHPGTSPLRKDKLYFHLDEIITQLKEKGYGFKKF